MMGIANTPTKQHFAIRTHSSSPHVLENPFETDGCVFNSPSPAATITNLVEEPLFHTAYLSDDSSQFSDKDLDDMSSYSVHSYDASLYDYDESFPDLLTKDMALAEQQCVQAQAVQIAFAGRPTVVELRNEKPTVHRASMMSFKRPVLAPIQPSYTTRPVRTSTSSNSSSKNSEFSDNNKSDSTDDGPTTPQLESGSITPTSDYSPLTPVERTLPNSHALQAKDLAPTSPTIVKATKKPSRLRAFARRTLSMHNPSEVDLFRDLIPEVPRTVILPPLPQQRQKLVARGPSERAPLLQLPPSPTDAEMPAIPQRNANRDTLAKPQRIRRIESHVGLNQR